MQKSNHFWSLGMNIITTCRCTVNGEVPHHFRALYKSFLCLGLSVPFKGGIYAKLKRVNAGIVWSFGINIFTTCQCTGKLHISFDFCLIFAWYRSHSSFNGEKNYANPQSADIVAMTPLLCTVKGMHVPHTLTILIGY